MNAPLQGTVDRHSQTDQSGSFDGRETREEAAAPDSLGPERVATLKGPGVPKVAAICRVATLSARRETVVI